MGPVRRSHFLQILKNSETRVPPLASHPGFWYDEANLNI